MQANNRNMYSTVAGRSHGNLKTTHSLSSQLLFEMSDLNCDTQNRGVSTFFCKTIEEMKEMKEMHHCDTLRVYESISNIKDAKAYTFVSKKIWERCLFLPPRLFQPLVATMQSWNIAGTFLNSLLDATRCCNQTNQNTGRGYTMST